MPVHPAPGSAGQASGPVGGTAGVTFLVSGCAFVWGLRSAAPEQRPPWGVRLGRGAGPGVGMCPVPSGP